jgi:hypothetical protein
MQGQHTYPWRDAIRMLSLRRFSTMPASASIASTLTQGIISAVNETAYRLGARVGETALDAARIVTDKT